MSARDRSARDGTSAAQAKLVARFRRLCLSLPETSEKASWGHPNFCVRGKIFAVYEIYRGRPCFAFQLEHPDQAALLGDPRFYRTPYVGHRGWVSLWIDGEIDWKLVEGLVRNSYRTVADKTPVKKVVRKTRRRAAKR
jgi:predicted DNA-binding protein (MmcQ/YjbR family)